MTQLTDDCFAAGGPLMTIEAALALVMPRLDRVTEAEEVPLAEAGGRILLADVTSPLELPEAGIRVGDAALATGKRLSPRDIWLAAALGRQTLTVSRPLKVALFSTGDELAELGQKLGPGQIYDFNRRTLGALLQQLGIAYSDLGILADRPEIVRQALAEAAADHDAVMTSGGVSTGDEDHVKAAVESLGSLHLWRLAIKPGRPGGARRIRRGRAAPGLHRPAGQSGGGHGHLPARRPAHPAPPHGGERGRAGALSGACRFRASQEAGSARVSAGAPGPAGRWRAGRGSNFPAEEWGF